MLALLLTFSAFAGDPAAGQAAYVAKCQACHGHHGEGDGPAAAALPKQPPNFTHAEFWHGMTDDHLKAAITQGKPSGVMRPFPMDDQQVDDLVTFLRTFEPAH